MQYKIYETILRRNPISKYVDMQMHGNLVTTTIYVLVSGLRKLSQHTPKPPILYRGIRDWDTINFFDVQRTGFLEEGFMSTSESFEVAMGFSLHCSKRPAVIEIHGNIVCADLRFFAHVASEREFLAIPLTLLTIRSQAKQGGIAVIQVHGRSLLDALTTEQISEVVLSNLIFFS